MLTNSAHPFQIAVISIMALCCFLVTAPISTECALVVAVALCSVLSPVSQRTSFPVVCILLAAATLLLILHLGTNKADEFFYRWSLFQIMPRFEKSATQVIERAPRNLTTLFSGVWLPLFSAGVFLFYIRKPITRAENLCEARLPQRRPTELAIGALRFPLLLATIKLIPFAFGFNAPPYDVDDAALDAAASNLQQWFFHISGGLVVWFCAWILANIIQLSEMKKNTCAL